ncbi:MAG: ATP-binding protein [Pseudomonadota bacterium]|nr:ATP-binding protein [Pseudomonadota bacterium]
MRLPDFIETSLPEIIAEWVDFASTLLPSAEALNPLALRDHAPQILSAIAADIRRPQSLVEQSAKSRGLSAGPRDGPHTAAQVHGALRARHGFTMTQHVSEFRALRASVLRLWTLAHGTPNDTSASDDITRFHEAIDQAIVESVEFFSRELTQERIARDAADRTLARNRARLEYATRLSRVGFWYCDLPFDVLEWDEQVKEHFFLEPTATITIDKFYERIHPEDREITRSAIAASIDSRNPYDIVYRTMHPATGQVKWIRALGGTNYSSDGSPVHFDGVTVDVTAQKLEERRISESETRHRSLFKNMEEAFTLFDHEFNIVDANDAACRLVGITRTELVGSNHWEQFPGTYESDLGGMYRKVLADGHSRSIENHYVYADGRQAWYEVRAFKVGTHVAVLFRDVTERRAMIEALQEADRRKDEFLAMLAHELRNPLAPIMTAGEILARIANPDAPTATATAVIRRQSRHMTRLIDDLLDVARVTQGRIHLDMVTVDIAEVIAQAVETCAPQLQAKQHHWTLSVDKSAPLYVHGDAVRLVQCVGNVLANAIKYTDARGEIEVRVRGEEALVTITIADSGSGIASSLLPQVFDLFVQSRRTLDRSHGGLGVGLAVVKRLVEMHGGSVRAQSEGEGKGSTFEIQLPRIVASAPQIVEAQAVNLTSQRILVVDDNVDAAESIVALLDMQGHIPKAVHTAGEALSYISVFKPDVMVIDIGLPGMDGYELVQQIDKHPLARDIKKIAVTGYGQPEDKQRALAVGFDAHLVKPVDIHALEQAIAGAS